MLPNAPTIDRPVSGSELAFSRISYVILGAQFFSVHIAFVCAVGIFRIGGNIVANCKVRRSVRFGLTHEKKANAETTGGSSCLRDAKSCENPALPMLSILKKVLFQALMKAGQDVHSRQAIHPINVENKNHIDIL